MAVSGSLTLEEQVLVDLAQLLARIQQYSAAHPACAGLAERTHHTLTRALAASSPITYGVLADDIVVGDAPTRHPKVRRLAAHLHERGLLSLRFSFGVTALELTELVGLLTAPAQAIYDKGGLLRLLLERGVVRVQVDEIAHDVTNEEREAQKRRKRLRDFFKEMLRNLVARRSIDAALREQLGELLEHPDIACAILEEDPIGIADAAAGFALMVRQHADRRGVDLAPKLRDVLLALSPQSRARVVIGAPALAGEFRAALMWAFEAFSESELARFAFAALRAHVAELDVVAYALTVIAPSEGRRLATFRWLALGLCDLPADDPTAGDVLAQLAQPVASYTSFREERECLQAQAARSIAARALFAPTPLVDSVPPAAPPPSLQSPPAPRISSFGMPAVNVSRESASMRASSIPPPVGSVPPPAAGRRQSSRAPGEIGPLPFNGRFAVAEVVRIAARTNGLARLCRALPNVAPALAAQQATDAVVGVVRGLSDAAELDATGAAVKALAEIGASPAANSILDEVDRETTDATDSEELKDMVAAVKIIVAHSPQLAVERLEISENRKMRRLLLDALPAGGEAVLPLVRAKLRATEWYVVRNAVLLIPRCGGTSRDLESVMRHPNEKVRLEVARVLRTMKLDETAMDIVAFYLKDASHDVSQAARILLHGESLGPKAIAALLAVAADEAQPEDLRRRVIDTFARSAHDASAAALVTLMQPHGLLDISAAAASMRDAAASALRSCPAPSAAALFEEGLHSTNRRIRKSCERAVGRR